MKSVLRNAVYAWGRFVTGARVFLAAIFLPIMVFGFIVFPEVRITTGVAIAMLTFVLGRHFRSKKTATAVSGPEMAMCDESTGHFHAFVSSAARLMTINVTIVLAQLAGAFVAWRMLPSPELVAAFTGAAVASIIGLGGGILVDRVRRGMWRHAPPIIRRLYLICTIAITSIGLLMLHVQFRPMGLV